MVEREASLPVRLLRLLAEPGIRPTSEIAQRLGISAALVRMMLEDLAGRGYLTALGVGECGVECAGCGLTDGCGARDRVPLMNLTARGRDLASS